MKTLLTAAFLFVQASTFGQGMSEIILPQYFGGKTAATTNTLRMNTVFRLTLSGLTAASSYRFTAGMVNSADASTVNGAGIFFAPGITITPINTGTLSATTEVLTTDGSGSVTFWLVVLTSGNTRFEPGTAAENLLSLRIGLNNGAGGSVIATRITSASTLIPLDLVTTGGRTAGTDDDGAFVEGLAAPQSAGKIVAVWDNISGTGRPLHSYIIEDNGIAETNVPSFYSANVAGTAGAYGLIMPSNNPNGVRRIQAFNADGTSFSFSTSSDGTWPFGANTVNPTRGSVTLITTDDAPLPVQLAAFGGVFINGNQVRLDWSTISELNNYGFYVERRSQGATSFANLPDNFVSGHGTTLDPQYYSFTDNSPVSGRSAYRLRQVDLNGAEHFTDPIEVDVVTSVTNGVTPTTFALAQNYPNPFNPETQIGFSVAVTGHTTLRVFSLIGQEVATLFERVAEAGQSYSVKFSGKDLNSGVYFYKLESSGQTAMKKLMFVK